MLRDKRKFIVVVAIIIATVMLAACGGGGTTGGGGGGTTDSGSSGGGGAPATAPATIKIGVPNPDTGPLATFGIGTPWAELLVQDFVNNELGGIYIEEYDQKIPIETIFVNTESSDTKAAEVTQQLITNDGVNILVARHTPGTALPVSATAEAMSVPFVSLECPNEPWVGGAPYEWGCHSFWYVSSICAMYMDMWKELGFGEGTEVGLIFPDDPDGNGWRPVFNEMLPANGFVVVDPGPTEMEQADWTGVINIFKQGNVKIVTGIPITPDWVSFSTQSIAQGFTYEIATIGRGCLFPAAVEASPEEIIPKITSEIWWSPWHPWTSSLTGMTCPELADKWVAEIGEPWSAPKGYKYAGMEIAVDALIRAASLDPAKIRDAIVTTDLETLIGHIKYQQTHLTDKTARIAETALVGGQWRVAGHRDDGSPIAEIDVVYNKSYPAVPINGTLHIPK